MGTLISHRDLGEGIQELGMPGYLGVPVIVVNRRLPWGTRRLALRHGLAHLVAGELEPEEGSQIRFMSSMFDYMTLEERRADLFAMADLIPDRELKERRVASYTEGELRRWVTGEVRRYAPEWPASRIEDRIALRMQL